MAFSGLDDHATQWRTGCVMNPPAQSMFIRRLGTRTLSCVSFDKCPEILELADGNFAIIGCDITKEAEALLPKGVGCGAQERIVSIPRNLLIRAKTDIPDV
jgi:hypothetical protein